MYISIVLSTLALMISISAVLVSIGVAMRRPSGAERLIGLASGARVPLEILSRLFTSVPVPDLVQRGAVVMFISPGCQPCETLLESISEQDGIGDLPILVIEAGSPSDKSLRELATFDPYWARDPEGLAKQAFETGVTPHAFIVKDGIVKDRLIGSDVSLLQAKAKALHGLASARSG
jgi:hypothetical protein